MFVENQSFWGDEYKIFYYELIDYYALTDSSEEDIDMGKVELDSESDDNWEETSDQEPMQEDAENGKSDDDASMSSSD